MSKQTSTPRRRTLTPWYPPHIKPVRKGHYQATIYATRPQDNAPYMRWNGEQWMNPYNNGTPCNTQERAWRGLARKP